MNNTILSYAQLTDLMLTSYPDQASAQKLIYKAQMILDVETDGNLLKKWASGFYGDINANPFVVLPAKQVQYNYLIQALAEATDYLSALGDTFANTSVAVSTTAGATNLSSSTDNVKILEHRQDIRQLLVLAEVIVQTTQYNVNKRFEGKPLQSYQYASQSYDYAHNPLTELWNMLFNDNVVSTTLSWSSSKINTQLGSIINDKAVSTNSTWSSVYIESLLKGINLDWVTNVNEGLQNNAYSIAQLQTLTTTQQTQITDINTKLLAKQPMLKQGTNITIIDNVISANTDLTKEWVEAQITPVQQEVDTLRNDQEELGNTVNSNTNAIDKINTTTFPLYQKKLNAGTNITIDETTNTISATGGSSDNLLTSNNTWSGTNSFANSLQIGKVTSSGVAPIDGFFGVVNALPWVTQEGLSVAFGVDNYTTPQWLATYTPNPAPFTASINLSMTSTNINIDEGDFQLVLDSSASQITLQSAQLVIGSALFTNLLFNNQHSVLQLGAPNDGGAVSFVGNPITSFTGVPSPTVASGVANKEYVDNAVLNPEDKPPYTEYAVQNKNALNVSTGQVYWLDGNVDTDSPNLYSFKSAGSADTVTFSKTGIYTFILNFWTNNNTNASQMTLLRSSGNVTFLINGLINEGNAYRPPSGSNIFCYWKIKVTQPNSGVKLQCNISNAVIGGMELLRVNRI